jgi:hypothetical protein
MSSSVSSERAFSGGGITLTDCCNRLKGDIVEALQIVKCAIQKDLLMQPPMPTLVLKEELENEDELEDAYYDDEKDTALEVDLVSDDEEDVI